MSYLELLETELQIFEIQLRQYQKLSLARYCDELQKWNEKINLTALSGAALVRRLILEPIWIARQLGLSGSLVDVGSGNGSPGIPFHIVCPFLQCHLTEVRVKRAAFLRHLVTNLKLQNVQVHRTRFEEITVSPGTVDWISLQAVDLTPKLVHSIRRIANPTTTILWITSPGAQSVLPPLGNLSVPITGTHVFLYRLDLT